MEMDQKTERTGTCPDIPDGGKSRKSKRYPGSPYPSGGDPGFRKSTSGDERMDRGTGGTAEEVEHPDLLPQALCQEAVCAEKSGFVTKIHTEEIGRICMLLGGGRAKKGDPIDLSVGLVLRKKVGDPVHSGESLAILHANAEKAGRRQRKDF